MALTQPRDKGGKKVWQRRDRKTALLSWLGWVAGVMLVLYCWRVISDATLWMFVEDAPQQTATLLSRMLPPNWSYLSVLWRPIWDTINIATLGTLLAILMAVPAAFLAARNTTPHPVFRQLALLVIVGSRSVNSIIWALILVLILGPGVLAGILAIALRSIGFIGKLLYEAIEEIDPKQVEAITATGASGAKVLAYGVVPQILPAFSGISIYRWDINIRESTVVGLVGAGGIGLQLSASMNALRWGNVGVIFVVIFILTLLSEWISARARQAVT